MSNSWLLALAAVVGTACAGVAAADKADKAKADKAKADKAKADEADKAEPRADGADRAARAKPVDAPAIVDRPITFDAERKRLTLAYRRAHQGDGYDTIDIDPRVIIVHYTGGNSADSTWKYFDNVRLTGRKNLAAAGAVNVSAHFLVDRDGTIYRLMPETWMARHCIGLNHIAIGIENVGDGDAHPLTDAQLAANEALIRDLKRRHDITHLIGHSEYRKMESHPYFLELDPDYRNHKPDPGVAFMRRLRARITDLELSGPPAGSD